VPAVVLTAIRLKQEHDAAFEAGADGVFTKPNTQKKLVTVTKAILDVRAPQLNWA
jgi:CheY-like chemotaxis protein